MAHVDKDILKSKFENGDNPSQSDFSDLIDSTYNPLSGITSVKTFVTGVSTTHTVTISSGFIVSWNIV